MSRLRTVVICSAVLNGSLTLGEDVRDRETGIEATQEVRIADADLKEDLSSLLEDHERLSSTSKGEEQGLRARLRESGEVVLSDEERSQMVGMLKAYRGAAGALYAGKVDRLLLRLGDSESIASAVRAISEGSPVQLLTLPDHLARSKQPAVITALAPDLFVDESIRPRLVGGDVRVTPRSVSAMHIMNRILVESDHFPEEVNAWARSLNSVKVEKRRELLRSWWNVNQEAMRGGRYLSTRPLSDAEQSLQSTDLQQLGAVRRIAIPEVASSGPKAELSTVARGIVEDGKPVPLQLSSEDRGRLANELRPYVNAESGHTRRAAMSALVDVGDRQGIEHTLARYHDGSASGRREVYKVLHDTCAQPAIIPLLAADLNIDEEPKKVLLDNEFIALPYSLKAAAIMRQIVVKSDAFTEDVHTWAQALDTSDLSAFRDSMRRWWEQNRAHFDAQDYGKVAPLRP